MLWRTFIAVVGLCLPPLAGTPLDAAELYRWQDERGVVHFSDNPHNIPKEFKEDATLIRSVAPLSGNQTYPVEARKASIELKKRGMTAVVQATINDLTQADFILDTGASYTVISSDVAQRVNIDLDKNYPKVRLQTANGIIDAPLVTLESVDINGMRVAGLTAAVHDFSQDDSVAGLLGLNFLNHFRMDLDTENGILVLERK
ncbi:MAG TPA: TIGR02281 family clan AA aspartic protease [Candidatus Binatia bacterium]